MIRHKREIQIRADHDNDKLKTFYFLPPKERLKKITDNDELTVLVLMAMISLFEQTTDIRAYFWAI
jgi:hypothetical protein